MNNQKTSQAMVLPCWLDTLEMSLETNSRFKSYQSIIESLQCFVVYRVLLSNPWHSMLLHLFILLLSQGGVYLVTSYQKSFNLLDFMKCFLLLLSFHKMNLSTSNSYSTVAVLGLNKLLNDTSQEKNQG